MNFTVDIIEIFVPEWLLIISGFLVSLLITLFSIPIIVRISKLKGLYDNPNGRTSHHLPTPNLGGVAIFSGVIISSVLFSGVALTHELKYIIAGMIVLFFLGLKDDILHIKPISKLSGQFLATLIVVVFGDIRITDIHGLLGIGEIGYIESVIVSSMLFLALINSFNLIDGIDGLASGIGIICSLSFGIWFVMSKHIAYAVFSTSLIGSLLIFFCFNVFSKKNKIFLGDTGSMIIGFLVTVFVVKFLEFENNTTEILSISSTSALALCVLIIPLFDTARVIIVRVIRGHSPFRADRIHIHHRLLDLIGSHFKVTLIIVFVNILFIAFVLIFNGVKNDILIIIILVMAAFFSYIPIFLVNRRTKRNV